MGDALGRGVRPVSRAERVVDVHVGELGELSGELGIVLRLTLLVPDVLQHEDVTRREVVGKRPHVIADDPGASVTSAPVSSASRLAAGLRDSSGSRSFGRPRWDTRIRRAPRSRSSSIVGSAARMRVSSATAPSSSGTLKSTRTRTRLPLRSPRSRSVLIRPSGPGPRDGSNSPTRCRTTTPSSPSSPASPR